MLIAMPILYIVAGDSVPRNCSNRVFERTRLCFPTVARLAANLVPASRCFPDFPFLAVYRIRKGVIEINRLPTRCAEVALD